MGAGTGRHRWVRRASTQAADTAPGRRRTAAELRRGALARAAAALSDAVGPGASDAELLSALTVCESTLRRMERIGVETVATLQRRGAFAERGYTSPANALADLLGLDRVEARRRVTAAEQVCERTALDGAPLPARLPATAAAFTTGRASLRHVEVIARVLAGPAAGRLTPQVWAGAEAQLAEKASEYTPTELGTWGTALVELLDADGAEPDDRPPAPVNELHLTRNPSGSGGRLKGRFDDAALYDAIATVVDAHARPRTAEDTRTPAQRHAEALADACDYVLDHADPDLLPSTAGRRPHLTVLIRLEDLENRARAAMLDFGGTLSPESLRTLACDAAVIPVVLNGTGQPLDVGRATRTIPDGLRRAVTARDRGCAHPGCDRPPSWCEIHHIREWEHGGDTTLTNLVMLCRAHHRQHHHTDWIIRIRHGLPEFIPQPGSTPNSDPAAKPTPTSREPADPARRFTPVPNRAGPPPRRSTTAPVHHRALRVAPAHPPPMFAGDAGCSCGVGGIGIGINTGVAGFGRRAPGRRRASRGLTA